MADFSGPYEAMILNEGGYKLTNIANDRGGQTYAGIARKANPNWPGWAFIDRGEVPPTSMVRDYYKANYWDAIRGDDIDNPHIARCIFDFGVNAGPKTAIKLAQVVLQLTPDGIIGPKTLAALAMADAENFILRYSLAKIARYRDIVTKDKTQLKFLLGWINRTLKEVSV